MKNPLFPVRETADHAVLLLHGLSSSPLELRFIARYLTEEGFVTHTPKLAGYSAGTGHTPMEQWISAAVAEFDALCAHYRHVSICGLSMGATLAASVAQERPAARAILLLSVTLNYDGWAMPWYRFLLCGSITRRCDRDSVIARKSRSACVTRRSAPRSREPWKRTISAKSALRS